MTTRDVPVSAGGQVKETGDNDFSFDKNEVAERIRQIRVSKGLTQQNVESESRQFAEVDPALEVISRPYLSQLEKGKAGNMSLKRLSTLLTVLDAEPEEIGIQLNRRRANANLGVQVIRVPAGVPVEVVENIRRILQLVAYGAKVEEQAIRDVSRQLRDLT